MRIQAAKKNEWRRRIEVVVSKGNTACVEASVGCMFHQVGYHVYAAEDRNMGAVDGFLDGTDATRQREIAYRIGLLSPRTT